jgi:hypothetical protein
MKYVRVWPAPADEADEEEDEDASVDDAGVWEHAHVNPSATAHTTSRGAMGAS